MATVSFDFKFTGFVGKGLCRITIGEHGNEAPIIVICSQKRGYHGTSITNALETIAAELCNQVFANKVSKVGLDGDPNVLDLLRNVWKKKLEKTKSPSLSDLYKRGEVTWVEHYPAGAGLAPEDSFMEVAFDTEGNPTWLSAKNLTQAKQSLGSEVVQKAFRLSREV